MEAEDEKYYNHTCACTFGHNYMGTTATMDFLSKALKRPRSKARSFYITEILHFYEIYMTIGKNEKIYGILIISYNVEIC